MMANLFAVLVSARWQKCEFLCFPKRIPVLSHPSAEAFPATVATAVFIVDGEECAVHHEIEQRLYAFVYSHSMLFWRRMAHARR